MQDGFEQLEEKVKKAADLVKRLRRDNKTLEDDLTKAKWRLQEAEKRLLAVEKDLEQKGGKAGESEALAEELQVLKQEREEVRRRVAKLVTVLDGLEA
jgi:chromosome segregation ATPase